MGKIESSLKILVITYDYHPDGSPNTYRWGHVLEAWAARGMQIFVVTAQKSNFIEFEVIGGVNVYRTKLSWFEKLKLKIQKKTVPNQVLEVQNQKVVQGGLMRKIYDLTWKKIYFPDFAFMWTTPAFNLAERLIKEEAISKVITVSWPFTDHVIGKKLKKKYNLRWIADTIDPFFLSRAVNNSLFYNSLNFRYERKILNSADAITVLTDKLKNQYEYLYPNLSDRIFVNHNIFVPHLWTGNRKNVNDGKIVLVFVGTLTPITRSPENVLRLFRTLINTKLSNRFFELHFYGNIEQCNSSFVEYEDLLDKSLFIHGLVSRERIPDILSGADVLVNIGNNNEYQEPSKIIEYIYMGKPILNVCSIINDSCKEILSKYPASLNIYEDDIFNIDKLKIISDFLINKIELDRDAINLLIKEYLLEEVEQRYFKLISSPD